MSALGQKQTCAVQRVMSALLPIADMCSAQADVRFVPQADMGEITCETERPPRAAVSPKSDQCFDQATTFRFLRQPSELKETKSRACSSSVQKTFAPLEVSR